MKRLEQALAGIAFAAAMAAPAAAQTSVKEAWVRATVAQQKVPLTLIVQGKDGKRETLEIKAAVKALGADSHGEPKH